MRRTSIFVPCGLAAAVAFSAAASAQTSAPRSGATRYAEMSLEELMEVRIEKVFSASKYEQKVTRAPASVTIVSADEIAAFGHRTLADVLRSVRGLYVSNDDNYSYLGARGFLRPGDYNMRTLVLIDGHRMNDNVYDGAYYGRETIATAAIERVEVIRGPSSSIYGNSAFFGVINIVTKSGRDLQGVEVGTEAGRDGTVDARVSYGRSFKSGLDVYLSANWYRTDGRARIYYPEFDPARSTDPRATAGGVARNSDAEDALQLFGKATYGNLTLSGLYTRRNKTVPTASFLTAFGLGTERTSDHRGYADLQYHRELGPDTSLRGRVFYDSYSYHGDYPYDWAAPGSPPDIVFNRDFTLGEWAGSEWQLTTKLGRRHTLVTGVEYRENLHQQQINYDDTQPAAYTVNEDRTNRTFGAYVQDEFTLAPKVLLNSGLRFDSYPGSFGHTFNPRFGLIYNPAPDTTVKLLHGRAFRAPNAYERFYYAYRMPHGLQPERVHTSEVALDRYFGRHYRAAVSVYRYHVSDLIEQRADAAGDLFFSNGSSVHAEGGELEVEAGFDSGWRTRASYARQRAHDASGTELTNSPRHLAKFNLIAPLVADCLSAGLEVQYHARVRTMTGQQAEDFTLTHLTLTARRVLPGLELSASVYNAFDVRYGYPGAEDHAQDVLPQAGRTVHVRAIYRF